LKQSRFSKTKFWIFLSLAIVQTLPTGQIPGSLAQEDSSGTLSARPIPRKQANVSALNYHEIEIDATDPRNREPLVKLADYGIAGQAYYSRKDGLNAPYYSCICEGDKALAARKSVAEKLQRINKRLAAVGLELFVLDAYRTVSCQRKLWDYFMLEAKRILATDSEARLREYAGKFCSNPTSFDARNYRTWPTHVTGGAVDLCLRRTGSGELLYMGGIFDDATDLSNTCYFEDSSADCDRRGASALEAMRNRRLLYWSMRQEGFANFANEWWHYDFGNQMWVGNRPDKQAGCAFYGAI
jgi:zinc D-Ala-D-Ala dipeptidase